MKQSYGQNMITRFDHISNGGQKEDDLFESIRKDDTVSVERLLLYGADADAINFAANDSRPLHGAAFRGNVAIVRMLIEVGACVDRYDYNYYSPLYFAVRGGHVDVAKLLIDAGADWKSLYHGDVYSVTDFKPDDPDFEFSSISEVLAYTEERKAILNRPPFKKTVKAAVARMENTVPCKICGTVTYMLGTKLCDRCWELQTRVEMNPDLAIKILIEHLTEENQLSKIAVALEKQ